jgi:hypothetical protein
VQIDRKDSVSVEQGLYNERTTTLNIRGYGDSFGNGGIGVIGIVVIVVLLLTGRL